MLFKRELSTEQLKHYYPAIFAEAPKSTTSDRYLYIPTYKLIQSLEQNGFNIVGAKQAGSRSGNREFAKHVVYMSHSDFGGSLSKVGEELPMLALTNSHNGLSSFAIDTAFFRLACSNGLLMPSGSLNSARVIHKTGMEKDVISSAVNVVQAFPEQIRAIESMKTVSLNRDEKMFLAEAAQNLAFDEKQIELNDKVGRSIAPRLLTARRHADQNDSLWTSFNVIQENLIKGGIRVVSENDRGERSFNRMRAVKSIDRDTKLNKELMALAQKMAELKGA